MASLSRDIIEKAYEFLKDEEWKYDDYPGTGQNICYNCGMMYSIPCKEKKHKENCKYDYVLKELERYLDEE